MCNDEVDCSRAAASGQTPLGFTALLTVNHFTLSVTSSICERGAKKHRHDVGLM